MNQNVSCWIFILLLLTSCTALKIEACPCENEADCNYPKNDVGTSAEVFAFSNGSTEIGAWTWDSISTFVAPPDFNKDNKAQINTMCITHSKGRKFSITGTMSINGQLNATNEAANTWVTRMMQEVKAWHADILTVDILNYFQSKFTSTEAELTALAQILVRVKKEIGESSPNPFKLACIVPWKPPCADDSKSCDFASLSNDACDFYIIYPDSFLDQDNIKCMARATIPMAKLLYGINEYNIHHVPRGKMILGVPWHGYTYECETTVNDVCYLPKKESGACEFGERNPIAYRDIVHDHERVSNADRTWFDAPHYMIKKNSKDVQIWYEDKKSLTEKYKLVHEMGLKGVALMYGDDLATGLTAQDIISDALMWSFVAHEFLLQTTKDPHAEHNNLHYADSMAGVAVGCLLLGTALGSILTCLALRNRIRRPKRSFMHQQDDTDGFIDEDDGRL